MKAKEFILEKFKIIENLDLENFTIKAEIVLELMDEFVKYKRKELLIDFCKSIKDYERESHNSIGFDERESNEFVEIFLSEKK
jgi:hypothetical protein